MNRRELFAAAGAAALMTAATAALAAEEHKHDGHGAAPDTGVPNAKLTATADACAAAGQVCINHCLDLFVKGDTSVAACAKSAYQMAAVCAAVARLASAGSPHLADIAKVALKTCGDCEKECRKHEQHHAACKACADACKECQEECKKVGA